MKVKRMMVFIMVCFMVAAFWGGEYVRCGNPEPVGCVNFVQGDLNHTRDGRTVPLARKMVIYKDSIIAYAPEYIKRDGLVQIVYKYCVHDEYSVFPVSFKQPSVTPLTPKELKELSQYVGGNLVLSSGHEDPVFEWYCNIKGLDEDFAGDFRIIISKTQSSVDTGMVKPLIFKLKSGVVISAIECSLWELDDYGKRVKNVASVEWKSEKDEWVLDFGKLPSEQNELYLLETVFVGEGGKKTEKGFIYKIFDKVKIQAIQDEALKGITGDKTGYKKKSALIQNYEDYDLILPSVERRRSEGLIVNGLLEEIWFE